MSKFSNNLLYGALIAGGITLLSATAATAAETSGENSTLGGTQVVPTATVPIDVNAVAVSVFGDSHADSAASAPAAGAAPSTAETSGMDSLAGGTQVAPVVTAPINVDAVAVSVFGDSTTTSTPGATSPAGPAGIGATTDGSDSVAGGSQIAPVITAPVTLSGLAVSVTGDSTATGTSGGSTVLPVIGGGSTVTDGSGSTAGGSQIAPVVTVPITLGGVAVSVTGDSSTGGDTGTPATPGTNPGTTPGTVSTVTVAVDDRTAVASSAVSALGTRVLASTGTQAVPAASAAALLLLVGAALVFLRQRRRTPTR